MNVYEQQARALKEIAAELKGIRRALDIISESMKPYVKIVVEGENPLICGINNEPCTYCSGTNCVYMKTEGVGNG